MKIYTKTGDAGTTSLVGGTRVSKAHPRVMAYGDLDELISYLGLLRCETAGRDLPLRRIQIQLMNVSAHLANDGRSAKLKPLDEAETAFLESEIDRMTAALPPQTAFVLPGEPHASSLAHVARTVCRRAERSAVQIEGKTDQDTLAIRYVNRLSDYLFTLARYLCDGHDDNWLP
jgi:ATP:cob(I)alamin adenosyltransferase